MNGVQTRFKCKLDVKRCKRFVFPPSSLLPRSNALKTKAIRYFQTDRTLTRIVSPPLRPLNMYALRYTENLDDAEDIVQQAFSDVWEKLVGGTSIQNLKAYMYQTVRNRSLTLVTNRQTHCETTELTDLEDLTEEERIIRSERDARLWTAIDHLPTERKKIFLLSKRDGLTYQEIATELGISIKTVEHQISKALKTLRETAIKIYTFFFG